MFEFRDGNIPVSNYGRTMKSIHQILLALAVLFPAAGHAETKEEWIALGARVHGAFGPFIPVGIRIGLDAMDKLKPGRVTSP